MAKWELEDVKKIAEQYLDGAKEMIFFSAPSRSIKCVVEVFMHNITQREATELICKGLINLQKDDFSESHAQWDTVMDIYGLENYENSNWFVKFCLFDDGGVIKLEHVSFHPPKDDLKLQNGRVLKANTD